MFMMEKIHSLDDPSPEAGGLCWARHATGNLLQAPQQERLHPGSPKARSRETIRVSESGVSSRGFTQIHLCAWIGLRLTLQESVVVQENVNVFQHVQSGRVFGPVVLH